MTIARSLLLALGGLTIALAIVAGLSVSSLYGARQDYEEVLTRTYSSEVAAANLLAAGVVEETVLRSSQTDEVARQRAAATFDRLADAAARSAAGDSVSLAHVQAQVAAQERARAAGAEARAARSRPRRAAALGTLTAELTAGRQAATQMADRQRVRREAARSEAEDDSERATFAAAAAGALALIAALALVSLLIGGLRRPLERLVVATRRLAGGDLEARVEPEGPAELQELSNAFNAMAADLAAAHERIEAGRLRLAAVIESLGDALIICDAYGRVTQTNPRAGDLVPELVPGHSVARDPGPLPPLVEALDGEVEVVHHDRSLSVTANRLGPSRQDGVVFTVRDVTERARLERAKSDFVATASHELRSPLTSIKGFVELLAATSLPDRQREFVDVILLSTNRLVELVNDLLDVARVEAGQLEIQRRPIAVGEAAEEVAAMMRGRLAEKEQKLVLDIPPALPAAWADPGRVRQIITNLLTNSHLYTPTGGMITISVGAAKDAVRLVIADTGQGMSREQLDRLFERFYRAGGSAGAPGTGLGMSIVKSLVDLHEGTIEVDSALGQGTTVTVSLPRAPLAAELAEPRDAIRGKHVLVVEDDPVIAKLIEEHLRPYEVETLAVHSGEEAIARLRTYPFDAVTLDILMTGADGFEVLRRIREDPDLRRIPVVVVSVLAGEEALAGEWSVAKPIDSEELTDAVGSAILAGRARVLVVARATMRGVVGPMLDRRGVEYAWATSAAEAARRCEEQRFEVALVDAGLRSPQAALAQLDLRGRRLRRSVVVFSADEDGTHTPGLARLDPDPMPVEDATQAVVEALRGIPKAE